MVRLTFPRRLEIDEDTTTAKATGELHVLLAALGARIDKRDLSRKDYGPSTGEAIEAFQRRMGLPAKGGLNKATVEHLNVAREHQFVADSRKRTERLHQLLQSLHIEVSADEIKSRTFGESTKRAVSQYQRSVRKPPTGQVSADLFRRMEEASFAARLKSKSQVTRVHRTLGRAVKVAKLDKVTVAKAEISNRTLGKSTQAAIKALQAKYGLKVTGTLDTTTYDRILSIAGSVPGPVPLLKAPSSATLRPISRPARLNMASNHIGDVQNALAFLGFGINKGEFGQRIFGRSTREAVLAYQKARSLPMSGHVDGPTLVSLNQAIKAASPQAAGTTHRCRVRGAVRNKEWNGIGGLTVQVYEALVSGRGGLLGERQTSGEGFFDIPYDPPTEATTGQVKSPYDLEVVAVNANFAGKDGLVVSPSKVLSDATQIAWANFTEGEQPYRGMSVFEERTRAIQKVIAPATIVGLVETAASPQISRAASTAGLAVEDVMRLVFSERLSAELAHPDLPSGACYAFIVQNLPARLPSDLLSEANPWTKIDGLVDDAARDLVFMDAALQASAFSNAIVANLMPISVGLRKDAVLAALASLRQTYALEKPIFIGNTSLKGLLETSTVGAASYPNVAQSLLTHGGIGPAFWADLNARANDFGGMAAVASFRNSVEIGHVASHFAPMVTSLRQAITGAGPIKAARDLAKLTSADWKGLINANGGKVPADTPGATDADKVEAFAEALATRSEQLFPAVALAATVGRSPSKPLTRIVEIQQLIDAHPEFDLRDGNLDVFAQTPGLAMDAETLSQTRVLQRVHRLAPTSKAGQALLDEKIHSSAQIVAMGRERFAKVLTGSNLVDRREAFTIYGNADFRYAQLLSRLMEYRYDLHRADPAAIVDHTYTANELPAEVQGNAELATLFGSLDYCSCSHCQSVYGPAAYLADLLRFLDMHDSEAPPKTVRGVLFDRRPDIGNIKLNCENTDTPLPYIDLACEVLENAIAAPAENSNFSFQTTRTAAELRASPEHVRDATYDTLRKADYPADAAFDLWQEEARVFLEHLGVPRWELMEAFQGGPIDALVPTDASIAGEYFKMSSHETAIVTATNEGTAPEQKDYWGFDPTKTEIVVADFMRRTRLSYEQVLELLSVRWLNPPADPNPMKVERPNITCNTDEQKIVNLTIARLNRMHRFLRLWRRAGWQMWELDLMIRAPLIGNGEIDAGALVRLKQLRQIQRRFMLSADQALSLFTDINTEIRVQVANPQREIPSLYVNAFLNPTVIRPVNPKFAWPLAAGGHLSEQKATLLAALSVVEADLVRLLDTLPNDDLSIGNLSQLWRLAILARGLDLSVKDVLTLRALSGASVFATPKATLDFIELAEWVQKAGLAIDELDYLLNDRPVSPYGMREEAITRLIETLRETLRTKAAETSDGTIISHLATAFGLDPDQVKLLAGTQFGGQTLLAHEKDPRLTDRNSDGSYPVSITAANFPNIYAVHRLVQKAALLVTRLKIDKVDLEWLLANATKFKLLEIEKLPVAGAPMVSLLPAWLSLFQWLFVERLYPQPEGASLRNLFDAAGNAATSEADVRKAIVALMPWKAKDLDGVAAGLGLTHGAQSSYATTATYLRVWKCFKQLGRLGADASTVLKWANRDEDVNAAQTTAAQEIRQAAKSKYDDATWLETVTPIEDAIREKKRDALIAYLVETSIRTKQPEIVVAGKTYPNPQYWRDGDDLLNYFLIDVQMCSCQLTSRIKQAISSVQMFVQRCLLGLEQTVVEVSRAAQQDNTSDNSWKQWRWMKSYRLWEANRKVFLYPENWIEPELRDDKSPFFEELEAEILQHDITSENVEAAFLHYLQKVHEVARLDIVSAYHEVDDTDPRDNLPPDVNVYHVVGRTRSQPAVYYYRNFDLNYQQWTAWQKIDVDIQSDQVSLVVYNRQLYLFWLDFVEKPQKVKKQPPAKQSDEPTNTPEPPNQLEIQLAWSVRKDGGWTAKQVSRQKLIHPWQRPTLSYNLKPRYKDRENLLWLDLYVSQSQDFNNTKFWDAYRNLADFVTHSRYDETARPWHSSSFVFDGRVVDVKMKALDGQYHVLDSAGIASSELIQTTSHRYVHDNFGPQGQAIGMLSGVYEIAPRLPLPDGMHYENTRLANNKRSLNDTKANVLENGWTRTVLAGARSPFEIVFSQHRIAFDTVAPDPTPFFYQDTARSFFFTPKWRAVLGGFTTIVDLCDYAAFPFYHPYTGLFMRELNRSGIDGLLNRRIQTNPEGYYPGNTFSFNSYSPPTGTIPNKTVATDTIDFERYGAYSIYNWEIFFHAPMLIAGKLSANQRFEDAMRWYHYIFDPTNTDSDQVPQRYWITRPFFEQNSEAYRKQRIDVLLQNIEEHTAELKAWKNDPFKPHLVARYRPVAYQKAILRKYLDNLIAWADQLFRRDTIEAINEATTLYVLAYGILGRKPVKVPNVDHADKSYNELTAKDPLDPFGNSRVEVLAESFTGTPVSVTRTTTGTEPLPTLDVLYFAIPNNDQLLGYWATIEDRLFKIRHCMNISGVVRQLPLFEPPIDPALLVKAAAAGVDLASVSIDTATSPSPYRFPRLLQTALSFCGEVRAFGDKLLVALEKYDAEGVALLRSTQEIELHKAVREIRKQQIAEAKLGTVALEASKQSAEDKKAYYEGRGECTNLRVRAWS